MPKRRVLIAVVVAVLVLAVAAAPAFGATRVFKAHLSGGSEVPPVETRATGHVVLKLSADGTELEYRLIVSKIEDVTGAHIHLGATGVSGPVVVALATAHPGTSHGVLATGTITSVNLVGPLAGTELSDLVAAIRSGDAYVNVHTVTNPGGAIRGQLR